MGTWAGDEMKTNFRGSRKTKRLPGYVYGTDRCEPASEQRHSLCVNKASELADSFIVKPETLHVLLGKLWLLEHVIFIRSFHKTSLIWKDCWKEVRHPLQSDTHPRLEPRKSQRSAKARIVAKGRNRPQAGQLGTHQE